MRGLKFTILSFILVASAFEPAFSILTSRHSHATALLPDGNIMLIGGVNGTANTPTDTVERYNFSTNLYENLTVLPAARSSHTATLMSSGTVLVSGGFNAGTPSNASYVYNLITNAWAGPYNMSSARGGHTATLINKGTNKGKILVCGGQTTTNLNSITASCELFNPGTNSFEAASFMTSSRTAHSASLLSSGRVFASAGIAWDVVNSAIVYLPTNEIYDPETNVWTPATALLEGRVEHTATVMNNGNVLIAAGFNGYNKLSLDPETRTEELIQDAGTKGFLDSMEMFDPNGGRVSISGKSYYTMPYRTSRHTSLLMPEGTVDLVAGFGNIDRSFFEYSPTFDDGAYLMATRIWVTSATINPASAQMRFMFEGDLSKPVSGRIVDGDLFIPPPNDSKTPAIAIDNAKIYLERSTAVIDGQPVGTLIMNAAPGDFNNLLRLYQPRGLITFDPQDVDGKDATVISSSFAWTGGPLLVGYSTALDNANSWVRFPLSFTVPAAYEGGTIVGTATLTGAAVTHNAGFYTIDIDDGGKAEFTGTVGANGKVSIANVLFTGIPGTLTNTTSFALNTGQNAAGSPIVSIKLNIQYTVDRIDLSGAIYDADKSTAVIRRMIFSSKLVYEPKDSLLRDLAAEETLMYPVFDHTTIVTPAADMVNQGGRNCESNPLVNCVRSNPVYNSIASGFIFIYRNMDTWPDGPALNTQRAFHTSTILADGTVLTCGGSNGYQTLNTCELYSKTKGLWSYVNLMSWPRANHTATLLPNGTVLIAGGTVSSSTAAINAAEIYYPDTRRFVPVSPMNYARQNHTAILLPDGNVLAAGGSTGSAYSNTAEVYIASAAIWQTVGNMSNGRTQHIGAILKNGRVLAAGGLNGDGGMNSSEIYNPATRTWSAGPNLNTKRYGHAGTLLRDGKVLVTGGSDNFGALETAELYNGSNWTYTKNFPIASWGNDMLTRRSNHTATLLPNGKVLVVGGEIPGYSIDLIEGYDVDYSTWQDQGKTDPRSNHTTVLLPDGYLMTIGGFDGATYLNTTQMMYFSYGPDTYGVGALVPRQPVISTGTAYFEKGQEAVYTSMDLNFHSITEASGGGAGPRNSSFYHPRIYIQSADTPAGYLLDLTTRFYTLYGSANTDWSKTVSTITLTMPSLSNELPYGWYHLRVENNGVFSNGFIVQVTTPRPTGSIANLTGTVQSTTTIRWSWNVGSISISDGYAIFSSSDNLFISTTALTNPATYYQTNLQANTKSSVKIGGYNTGGFSLENDMIKSATYYTLANPASNLVITRASFETVGLEWSPNGNSSITPYEVSLSLDSNFLTDVSTPVPFSVNYMSTAAVISSLSPNKTYYFRVQAKNGADILTTFSGPPYISTITVGNINNLQGWPVSKSEIRWSWDPSEGADGYEIYDVTQSTESAVFVGSTSASFNYFNQTNLSTNTAYSVRVHAFKNAGGIVLGPAAYSSYIYTLAVSPLPGAPNAFTSVSSGSMVANWISNGNPGGTVYVLEYSTNNFTDISSKTTTDTSTVMDKLTPNTNYAVRIYALNGNNVPTTYLDGYTSMGSRYTKAQPPNGVQPVSIEMSGVTIQWDRGQNPYGTTVYEIRGSTVSGFNPSTTYVPFSQNYTGVSYKFTGLLTSTTYYFDVAAMNGQGEQTAKIQCVPEVVTLSGPSGTPKGSIGGTSTPGSQSVIAGALPNGMYASLTIPANAFASETAVAISSSTTNSCSYLLTNPVAHTFEVAIYTENNAQPQVPVTLTLYYNSDEAAQINSNSSKLVLARYNSISGQCLPLDTAIQPGPRTITASMNHFSVFQLMLKEAAANLTNVLAYPNPFYMNRGDGYVTIENLPSSAKVTIYTLSGEKVWEGTAKTGGILTWNGINKYGEKIASGIYLALIDSSAGKKVVKIAVER